MMHLQNLNISKIFMKMTKLIELTKELTEMLRKKQNY